MLLLGSFPLPYFHAHKCVFFTGDPKNEVPQKKHSVMCKQTARITSTQATQTLQYGWHGISHAI